MLSLWTKLKNWPREAEDRERMARILKRHEKPEKQATTRRKNVEEAGSSTVKDAPKN